MATRDRRKIRKALRKKGFTREQGSSHEIYTLDVDGLTQSVATIISRGSSHKVYGSQLLSDMADQLQLSNQDLLSLIDCPLKQEEYLQKLSDKGIIP